VERAALAGADCGLDVVKERFSHAQTGVFEDAGTGIRDESIERLRDKVISRVQETMRLAHQDP
jgi:hypothetical protein